MKDFKQTWFIAGGWAIDLYLGRITREHKDIEIGIFRRDQLVLREYLKDWVFQKIKKHSPEKQGQLEKWRDGEYLEPPTHEIHATNHPARVRSNLVGTQIRNTPLILSELEILLNERDDSCWIYRRNSQIRREIKKTILNTVDGIPYLAPEIVLLYKSKKPESRDESDFGNTVNLLGLEPRTWFRTSLHYTTPLHHWLNIL
jgi:hypothetical protein